MTLVSQWAATALHELGHWTSHASRLKREEGMKARLGSAAYEMEELRAELSSAFIAVELGIPANVPQHASYIADWLKKLKDDKRENFGTAADAQKIVDLVVLGVYPEFASQIEPRPGSTHRGSIATRSAADSNLTPCPQRFARIPISFPQKGDFVLGTVC
jgi:antirestriction protein ArdC